jgi:hypothetical protein
MEYVPASARTAAGPLARHFDGISTIADPAPLLSGRFAALHEQFIKLNPMSS